MKHSKMWRFSMIDLMLLCAGISVSLGLFKLGQQRYEHPYGSEAFFVSGFFTLLGTTAGFAGKWVTGTGEGAIAGCGLVFGALIIFVTIMVCLA